MTGPEGIQESRLHTLPLIDFQALYHASRHEGQRKGNSIIDFAQRAFCRKANLSNHIVLRCYLQIARVSNITGNNAIASAAINIHTFPIPSGNKRTPRSVFIRWVK